jgi:hypothetical protein
MTVIELRDELRDALPKEFVLQLAQFIAVSELDMPDLAKEDATALRLATAREVLNILGVTDRLIEVYKAKLDRTQPQPQSLRRQ